jgi:hypothetical protein
MNPSRRSHLGDQILRVLNIVLENRDERGVLLREELLRNCTTFLAHANLLGVQEQTFYVSGGVSTSHVRDR